MRTFALGAANLFKKLVATDRAPVVITDACLPDNPIVECNEAFLSLSGYTRLEVVGRNCRFMAGPMTSPDAQSSIRKAIEEERPTVVELVNYRKDGETFLNSLMIAPIHDAVGKLIGFLGSQMTVPGEKEIFVRNREIRARRLAKNLTRRQAQVLSMIARGMLTKQIAHELGLSERTVKMHRAEMLKQLGVQTNGEAIRIAVRAMI